MHRWPHIAACTCQDGCLERGMQTQIPPSRDIVVANLHGTLCGSSEAHLQSLMPELASPECACCILPQRQHHELT